MSVSNERNDSEFEAATQGELGAAGAGSQGLSERGAGPAGSEATAGPRPPVDGEAPAPGITGASTSQGKTEGSNEQTEGESGREPHQGGGGVDWLEIRCAGEWLPHKLAALEPQLDQAKVESQEKRGGTLEHPDGGVYVVHAKGYRSGKAAVEWMCEFDGISVDLTRERSGSEEAPNAIVTLRSMILMQLGHVAAWEQACRFLSGLGFQMKSASPTRLDICVDLVGHEMEEYNQKFLSGAYICRARHDNEYREHRRVTGLRFGKEPSCRIYDKVRECMSDPRKWEVVLATRYGGHWPVSAVRVEFQSRRATLRDRWSVTTIDDLFSKLPAIAVDLSTNWLRFTEKPVDREGNHQERADVWTNWAEVQQLFQKAFSPNGVDAPRRVPAVPSVESLVRQSLGGMMSAAASENFQPKTEEEFLEWITRKYAAFSRSDWKEVLERRRQEIRARSPVNLEHSFPGEESRPYDQAQRAPGSSEQW